MAVIKVERYWEKRPDDDSVQMWMIYRVCTKLTSRSDKSPDMSDKSEQKRARVYAYQTAEAVKNT